MAAHARPRLVVIGGSRGALRNLQTLLGELPANFPVPVIIVLHRLPDPASRLVEVLGRYCALPVSEPTDKQAIAAGTVWLAPADYHLLVTRDSFALSTDPPITYSRPSIDVLFESAADAYGDGVLAILLTGNSADGSAGLESIRRSGGITLVENPGTAESPVMPASAISRKAAGRVLRLADLTNFMLQTVVDHGERRRHDIK